MAIYLSGTGRLGRDAELRFTQSGESVSNLSIALTYGKRAEDGQRQTMWVDAVLWGRRAEALVPFLKKGLLVAVWLEDAHLETYTSQRGEGVKMVGRVQEIEMMSAPKQDQDAPAPAPQRPQGGAAAPRPARPPARPAAQPQGGSGFDDMDDDMPF